MGLKCDYICPIKKFTSNAPPFFTILKDFFSLVTQETIKKFKSIKFLKLFRPFLGDATLANVCFFLTVI